jgi:PKD repeat protein
MKKIVILFINITCYYFGIFAQCPTSSFTVNPVCGNDSVVINTTTPAGYTHYSWDYCSGELGLDSIVRTSLSPFSSSFSVSSSKLVTDGQDWFLFALTNNILYRLDFGHSLDNVPTVQNLGTPGGANSPYSIDFVLENNNWYALVTYNASIRLLNFGNALVNTPSTSAITLPTGTLASPRGLTLARDNDTLVALIVGNTNNRIRLLRFGTSILNPITAADTLSIPHDVGTGASNIALAKECNSWYALVNATASGRINRINLGSKLFDTNSSVDSLLTGPSNSSELVLVREGGRFKAFFNTFTSTTVRLNYLDFGASMLNTPAYTSKNFTGVGTGTSGLSLAVNQSKWTAFLISQSLNSLVTKLNFYEPCQAQPMTFSGQIPLSPVYQTIGNFKIAQTVDSLGVTSATAQPVSFSPKPIANFTLNNVCKGETTIFTNTSTSGLPITNLLWNFGGNDTVSNQNSVQRIFSGFGTYPSSLTVINSAGCASAITKQAKVFDKPIAGFYNNVICAGEMLDITDTSTVAIDTINHWFWTIEGQSFSQQNPSMVTALGGNVVSTLIVETNMGCKDTLTKSLMVKPSPDIDVLITDACFGNTTTFGNNTTVLSPAIMSTYEWSFGDNTGSTLVSPVKQYNNPGVYPITLIATADNNCSDTLNTLLTIGNPPATNFDVVGTCQNSNIQFVDLSVGTDSVVLWNWNFGDGTFSTLKNPNKVYASPGSFVVTLCAGVGPGCDSCISKVVNVSAMPIANFSADTVCFGQPTAFQNLSSVALPQNIVSYKWYLGNGDSASIATPSYVYPNAGGYTCTLDVVSDSGCISSFSKSVFIYSNPIANFTVNPECVGNQVAFTNTSLSFNGAVNKWNWNFGDGTFDSVPNPTHTFSSAAVYNVKLNVESEFGCSDSIQKNAGPVFVSIIASDTACVSASVNLSATSNGLTNYEWDYCSGELGLDSIVRTSLSPFSSGFSVSSSKLVTDGQDWFLFALTNNILYRLDFGHSLDNVPTVQNLGTPGGANSPYSIDFVLENNNWYALVTYNASIRLLNFGNALVNTPSTSAITLPTGTLASPRGLTLARDNDTLVALIVGNTNNRIRLLRFGTSILNPITAADTLSIPHDVGTGASNIALAKDCNSWYALVNATASGRINRINLGSKLFDTNSSVDSLLTGPSNSSELVLVREGGRFKAFFQHIYIDNRSVKLS